MWDTSRLHDHTDIHIVYQNIRVHLRNLAKICDLVRNTRDGDQPLISTVEEVNSHSWLAVRLTDSSRLLLDQTSSSQELLQSADKARKWQHQIISFQSHYDRAHFLRLFRTILEKEPRQWTDLQQFYYALTNPKIGDAVQRLRVAFAICREGRFADKYALELCRAREAVHLKSLSHSSHVIPAILAARHKLADKAESSKIDSFTCAVSLSSIHSSACEAEKQCPICRESFIDLTTNTIQDLLADYPVRIKYCGHVVGKSCLEMWWDTPNKDPARYPFKTCPLCRTNISDPEGEEPQLSEEIMHRIRHSRFVSSVKATTGMENEDVVVGVKRGMNEEIALMELGNEVERVKSMGSVVEEAEEVLKERLREIKAETEVWGISRYLWDKAREEWMETGVKK
jgi:hypothetical protein